jgi:hypothetical protein
MKKVPAVIFLVLLFQFVLRSATPTISNISVTADTNAVTVSYNVSADSYCWVQYGMAAGSYLWSSVSFMSGAPSSGLCSTPINGLKDGTTYYFLPTARPDPDDEASICNVSGCGAREVSATTPSSSVSHLPALPTPLQANMLTEPDTTSYAVITVQPPTGNPAGECEATSSIKAPNGYSWNVTAGQPLTRILATVGYGTVIQIPQGVTCNVPPVDSGGRGYMLPQLAVDPLATSGLITAANHRWLVFRSSPGGPADFPPFGTRTGPAFFPHYGILKSVTPKPPSGSLFTDGIIFAAPGTGKYPVHHVWIENLEFEADETQTTANFDTFFTFALSENGDRPPYPEYISLRGIYFHGPDRSNLTSGAPSVSGAISGAIGTQAAIVGNYIDDMYYTSRGIPIGMYFQDGGNAPASEVLIDNNYEMGMAMNIYTEINNHNNPNPSDFTITHNALYWPIKTYQYAKSIGATGNYGCRNQIELKGMTRSVIAGNYINGQWACANAGGAIIFAGSTIDSTIRSNLITASAAGFAIAGTGNGTGIASYSVGSNRILVANNLLYNLGRTLFNAGCCGLGATLFEMDSSPTNVTIVNNTFGPITDGGGFYYPWILYSGGGGQLAGLTMQNNILPFAIGNNGSGAGGIAIQNALCANGARSTCSHPYTPLPASWGSPVDFTFWLDSVAGYTDGRPATIERRGRPVAVGAGMQGASVISGGSGYPNSGPLSFNGCTRRPAGTYTAANGVIQSTTFTSFGASCNAATFSVLAVGPGTGASFRPAYGLNPNYVWGGNVDYCTTYQGSDMDMNTCSSLSATMPSGDVWASGATTAARMVSAGLAYSTSSNYHCLPTNQTSCTAGANIGKLESDLGIVSQISAAVAGDKAMLAYVAPDSRGCSADISADGATWTRTADSGGDVRRSISWTGLLPGTTYQYRLLCYYDQTQPWFAFPSDSSNINTSGTFITATAAPPAAL